MPRLRLLPALLLALCGGEGALAAQAPSVLIPAGRADQLPVSPTYRRPVLAPRMQPVALAPAPAPFLLRAIQVHGSSLDAAVLQRAYAAWLGRTVDEAGLKAVAEAV